MAVDTETTGVKVWHGDQPFALSFANEDGDTHYFEWEVDPWTRTVVPKPDELEAVREFMLDRSVTKVFHNAKFDMRMLENIGIEVFDYTRRRLNFPIEDTMFMAWTCNTMEPSYGLKNLTKKYCGIKDDDKTSLQKLVNRLRRKAKQVGWSIAYDEEPQEDGTSKLKGTPEADYWLPLAASVRHPEWLNSSDEADYCRIYAVRDVERTIMLKMLYEHIMGEDKTRHTYEEEMNELWSIVFAMERRGVALDYERCLQEEKAELKKLRVARQQVVSAAWPGFKGTPRELQKLLFDPKYLGLDVKVRTEKSREPATNVDALRHYDKHPVVQSLHKWRAAHKGWGTFFRKYRRLSAPEEGQNLRFIHTDFQQLGPMTRRFSSRTPNLQNVANALTTRSSEPIQARTVFIPRPGYTWYHWDFHQIEVRIFADLAQEEFMLSAIRDGRDLHTECTNKAWGGKDNPAAIRAAFHSLEFDGSGEVLERKTPELLQAWKDLGLRPGIVARMGRKELERRCVEWLQAFNWDIVNAEKSIKKKTSRAKAKMVLFAKQFGGGGNAVKDLLFCSYDEAVQFLEDYSVAFPRIDTFMDEVTEEAKAKGYIYTPFGTRLAVDPDKAYQGVNRKVQGGAADLLKRGMVKCNRYLLEEGCDIHTLLTIHDELTFEARDEHATRKRIIKLGQLMSDHEGYLNVETPVELEMVNTRWNEKKKVPWMKEGGVNPWGFGPRPKDFQYRRSA